MNPRSYTSSSSMQSTTVSPRAMQPRAAVVLFYSVKAQIVARAKAGQ